MANVNCRWHQVDPFLVWAQALLQVMQHRQWSHSLLCSAYWQSVWASSDGCEPCWQAGKLATPPTGSQVATLSDSDTVQATELQQSMYISIHWRQDPWIVWGLHRLASTAFGTGQAQRSHGFYTISMLVLMIPSVQEAIAHTTGSLFLCFFLTSRFRYLVTFQGCELLVFEFDVQHLGFATLSWGLCCLHVS